MGLIRTGQVFEPEVIKAPERAVVDPDRPRRLTTAALCLCLLTNLLALISYWVPELTGVPGRALLLDSWPR